jgi:hypothetical protein
MKLQLEISQLAFAWTFLQWFQVRWVGESSRCLVNTFIMYCTMLYFVKSLKFSFISQLGVMMKFVICWFILWFPLWKMGWLAIGLATRFLSYNDHLQFIATQHIYTNVSVIEQVPCVTMDVTHYIWNHIHMQLKQFNYNYVGTITMQF